MRPPNAPERLVTLRPGIWHRNIIAHTVAHDFSAVGKRRLDQMYTPPNQWTKSRTTNAPTLTAPSMAAPPSAIRSEQVWGLKVPAQTIRCRRSEEYGPWATHICYVSGSPENLSEQVGMNGKVQAH